MKRKGFFARLADLWRGFWGVRLDHAEVHQTEAVYHRAIEERIGHQAKLKDAVSRLVYLRNRTESAIAQKRKDLELTTAALQRAVLADRDQDGVVLLRKQRALETEIERLEGEHARLQTQSETAKQTLAELSAAVTTLKQERAEMLARKAHASARLDAQQVLASVSGADLTHADAALENVREAIFRLEGQAGLHPDVDDGTKRMAELEQQIRDEADQDTLRAMKMKLRGRLLVANTAAPSSLKLEEVLV